MRRTTLIAVVLFGLFLSAPALAISVEQVPNPRPGGGWVSDPIDLIPADAEARLNARIDALERDLGVEIAVVVVEEVDAPTPKDFATELFNHWGIGKAGVDNGLLVLLVHGERRLEMETGYGTEAVLTDGWLKRMQMEQMVPHFKAGDFARGLEEGVAASDARLRQFPEGIGAGASTFQPPGDADDGGEGVPWWLLLLGGAAGLGGVGGAAAYRHRKLRTCPNCHTRMQMLTEEEDDAHLDAGQRREEELGSVDYQIFYCETCGFDRFHRDNQWFSGYSRCPKCHYKTLKTHEETLVRPTTSSTGRKRVTVDCKHCGYHHVHHITLPRVQRSSSSGGGFGGSSGGGGGSFGGGSSGGGGAGSSW